MADTIRAEGITGQIEVSNGIISITRKGLRASLSQGKKGELTIPVNHVTKVDYKKASFLINGHIHFLIEGESEDSHRILNCPMTVIFNRKQEVEFEKLAELVSKLKDEVVKDIKMEIDTQTASNPNCPHCKVILDPIPKRKTKCPSCGKDIYVRTDPFNKQKIYYLKHDDALLLNLVRNLPISEKAFTEAKNKSVKGQSLGDVIWGLIGQESINAARKGDWQTVKFLKWSQARYLYETGREYFHVQQAAMKEELQGVLASGLTHVKILSSQDDRTCEKCKSQDGMVFTIEEALEKMPLPVKCDNGEFCRCSYTYHRMK